MPPDAGKGNAPDNGPGVSAAEIARLTALMEAAGITELDCGRGGWSLRLRLESAAPAIPPASAPGGASISEDATEDAPPLRTITAPCAGVFIAAHPLREAPAEGMHVAEGGIAGFLRVGPCLRPVIARESGVIAHQLVADGTLVGYGTALFTLG